jgi:hypothetical protein
MAFPPPVLPINRTDATPQQTTHANDHNAANQAINDITAKVTAIDAAVTAGAPGYVGNAFVAAEQTGIAAAWIYLNSLRVDYADVPGHQFLILYFGQGRKGATDTNADSGVRVMWAGQAGTFNIGQSIETMNQGTYNTFNVVALRAGGAAAPCNVQVQASTAAGWLNIAASALYVIDLGP